MISLRKQTQPEDEYFISKSSDQLSRDREHLHVLYEYRSMTVYSQRLQHLENKRKNSRSTSRDTFSYRQLPIF